MPIDMRGVNYAEKQQLLAQIRANLGDEDYERLVAEMGEAQIIQTFVEEASVNIQASKKKSGEGSSWGWLIFWVIMIFISGYLASLVGASVVLANIGSAAIIVIGAVVYDRLIKEDQNLIKLIAILGIILIAIAVIAGIVFLFVPSLGWPYALIALYIAVALSVPSIGLIGQPYHL